MSNHSEPITDEPVIDGPRGKVFVTLPGQSSATTSVLYEPLRVLCGACTEEATEFDTIEEAESFARVHVAEDRAIAAKVA